MEADREILCIPAGNENYGVDFPYVVEICREFQISSMPCLREPYCGVSNYKGMIIPVVELCPEGEEHSPEHRNCSVIVVVRLKKYWLGILTAEEPFIVSLSDARRIQDAGGDSAKKYWVEKELYEKDGRFCSVIDLEKTMEGLILYP